MRRFGAAATLVAVVLASTTALAQPGSADARARAKEAYDHGVDAHARGDMQGAAKEFARADAILPSPIALRAALDAAIEADDPALGAELLDRSARAKPTGPLAASIRAARRKFAGRAGKVRVQCPAGHTCTATFDGDPIEPGQTTWARTGQHTVVVQVDGDSQTKAVRVEPDRVAEVSGSTMDTAATSPAVAAASASPPPPPAAEHDGGAHGDRYSHGLPRIYFFAGVGATVLLGGLTTYFAIDTKNKHDQFQSLGCDHATLSDCQSLRDGGEGSQTATNIGLVLTGAVGIATAVVGIAFTDWHGPMIAALPGGAAVAWARRF